MLTGTFTISNRRYLGNKYRLLPFIRHVADERCRGVKSVFDVFAGTGSVAYAFIDKQLTVNDMMYSNYLSALTWFSPEEADTEKLASLIESYNTVDTDGQTNYLTDHFAGTYFSRSVCARAGYIRDDIEARHEAGEINCRERAIAVTALLYALDRIAATCGHYDAYIKGADLNASLQLRMPDISRRPHPDNRCTCADANAVAPSVSCDLAYLDPPYNSRQYCDAYHLPENIARWQKPPVTGTALKPDRTTQKSLYSTASATSQMADLVSKLRCRYILLSYNNTGTGLNPRSNAKISDQDLTDILLTRGPVEVFSQDYRPFSAGRGAASHNQERLFLCTVRQP